MKTVLHRKLGIMHIFLCKISAGKGEFTYLGREVFATDEPGIIKWLPDVSRALLNSRSCADQRAVARTSVSGTKNIEIKPYPTGTCSKFFEIDLVVNKAKK